MRIATREWVNQVFDLAIYYTGARRKMFAGQKVVFVHKTPLGDAFVGYGEIANIYGFDDLSEAEKLECEKWGWRKAIEFKYVVRFEAPLLLKETSLKGLKAKGKTLHCFPLDEEKLNEIISAAEMRQRQKQGSP